MIYLKKVFVCSPCHGDIEANTKLAKSAAEIICDCGSIPIVPHLYFPQFLDDNDRYERIKGIEMGVELIKECDMVWVVGSKISRGMEVEINEAGKMGIPIRFYDENLHRIEPAIVIPIEEKNSAYRYIVKGFLLKRDGRKKEKT